jgi:hypothetical protein
MHNTQWRNDLLETSRNMANDFNIRVKDFNTILLGIKDFDTIIKILIPFNRLNDFKVIFIDEAFYKCLRSVLFHHRLIVVGPLYLVVAIPYWFL